MSKGEINFEARVDELVGMIEPQGVVLQPESRQAAIDGFSDLELNFGEESAHPLGYHNAPHGIDTTERAIILANLLLPLIPEPQQFLLYDKIFWTMPKHDRERFLKAPGANERVSADKTVGEIEESGNPLLNTDDFKSSVSQGMIATEMRMQDGDFVQVNLRRTKSEPFIFIAAAADVGGIPMEGRKRMWRDAIDLAREKNPNPTAKDIYDSLLLQAGFLKNVTDDKVVKPNIEHHFPDSPEEVYKLLRGAFHGNVVATYRLALLIHDHPELESIIGRGPEVLDHLRVGSLIGRVISKSLRM